MRKLFHRAYQTRSIRKLSRIPLPPNALLIDLREPEEFQCGHLSGAINIPSGFLSACMGQLGSFSRPLFVYCQSGERSKKACRLLAESGFSQVTNLSGGLDLWDGILEIGPYSEKFVR